MAATAAPAAMTATAATATTAATSKPARERSKAELFESVAKQSKTADAASMDD